MDDEKMKEGVKNFLGGVLIALGLLTVYGAIFGDLPPSAATDGLEATIEGVQSLNETMILPVN